MTKNTSHYTLEPVLSSELILVNNSKKLKEDPSLLNDNLQEVNRLKDEFIHLSQSEGLQKEKRRVRDELTDASTITFMPNDGNDFAEMIIRMTEGVVSRPQFSGYSFKEEMKSLAIQHILLYTNKFDPYRTSNITGARVNAFAYISQIIFNACIATINNFNRDQKKAKDNFLETQKLIHRDPNASTIGAEFENANRRVHLPNLKEGELLKLFHKDTITEATEYWVPTDYKISDKELAFCLEYVHNISIRRIKGPEKPEPTDSWFPDMKPGGVDETVEG